MMPFPDFIRMVCSPWGYDANVETIYDMRVGAFKAKVTFAPDLIADITIERWDKAESIVQQLQPYFEEMRIRELVSQGIPVQLELFSDNLHT